MISLRGHHLICLQFYRGEGYDKRFVENLEGVLMRAEGGEEILVVSGPDDICRSCPTLRDKECVSWPGADAEIRQMDAQAMGYLGVKTGSKVRWQDIKARVMAVSREWLASFCKGCGWEEVCIEKKKNWGLV
ncbi:DUF1284 domain-containing protein [Desulfofundulus thermocisternus]|uniref:DUF1284 domain-containing protein n=1 Tax=Desulfofundulus thermocisternus TaxID=42471 RepID=UPI0019E80E57|nr:DUF1284 domain-containing protein [Desulfofundulus thermocisternus]MBE3585486.1 DUF1284 domain-containing protein [Thermoanaerobacter sp.]MCS5696244.1 DUF1284 domain-containing protein [Desulfofundulus thermocisternus]